MVPVRDGRVQQLAAGVSQSKFLGVEELGQAAGVVGCAAAELEHAFKTGELPAWARLLPAGVKAAAMAAAAAARTHGQGWSRGPPAA